MPQTQLLQALPDAAILTDPVGVVRGWNDAAARLYGWTAQEMVGRPVVERFPAVARAEANSLMKRLAAGGQWDGEYQDYRKDGTRAWVESHAHPVRDATGAVTGILSVSRAIPADRAAEIERERNARYAADILDAMDAQVAVLDPNGRIRQVNRAWERFAAENTLAGGVAASVGVGVNYLRLCRNCTGDKAEEAGPAADGIEDVLRGRLPSFELEYPCDSPTETRWFAMHVTPLTTAEGGAVVAHYDITARKRAELAAAALSRQTDLAMTAAHMGVWTLDVPTGRVHWSAEVYRIVGVDDFDGTLGAWNRLVHPDDLPRMLAIFNEAVKRRMPFNYEFRIIRPGGEVRWLANVAQVECALTGEVVAVVGTVQDVTARKRSEWALTAYNRILELIAAGADLHRVLDEVVCLVEDQLPGSLCSILIADKSTGRLRFGAGRSLPTEYNRAVDGIPVGPKAGSCGTAAFRKATVAVTDIATDPLWDDYRGLALGHGLRSCVSVPIFSSGNVPGHEKGEVIGTFALYNRAAGDFDRLTYAILTGAEALVCRAVQSRSWTGVERESAPIIEATHLAGVAIERDQAGDVVRESEERFRAAVEVAELGVIAVDYERQIADLSPQAAEQFGLPPGVGTSRADLHARFHPDDRAELERQIAGALDPLGMGWFALEHRVIRPDGTVRWLHVRKQVSFADGRPRRAVVVTADVTDRRQAESRLREQDLLLREASELAQVGGWGFDPATLESDWTSEVARIYGLDPAAPPAVGSALEFFSRNQRPTLEAALTAAIQFGTPHDLELQMTAAGGQKKWVRTICRPTVEDGRVVRVRGSLQDITGRKRAEEALRASEVLLRTVTDNAAVGLVLLDRQHRYVFATQAYCNILGLPGTSDELIGRGPADVMPDVYASQIAPRLERAFAGERVSYELSRQFPDRPDGTRHYVVVYDPKRDETGVVDQVIVTIFDITERKRSEQALVASEERLQEATRVAGVGVFEHDHRAVTDFWSARLRDIMGCDPDAPASLTAYLAMIHPDDRDAIAAAVHRAHDPAGDGRFEVKHRLIRPANGQVVWLAMQSQTRFEGDGADRRPVRTVGATVDETVTRLAAEALRTSEARYRRLMEVLPTAVFVHDGTRMLFCNPAFVRLIGVPSADAVVGRETFICVHPDDRPLARVRLAATGEGTAGGEMRFARDDGRPVRVFAVSTPITGYGHPAYLVALSDLSDRERAMDLLRTVLGSVGDAILTIDTAGRVGSANPATERLFGYTEDELVGGNVNALMPDPHHDRHDGYIDAFLRTGRAKVIGVGREVEARRKDGSTFPAELTVNEFALDGERHFTGVLRDITTRKKLEEQFHQSQKMEAVGRLAGGVAHDFNNLLTVINGYCELLMLSDGPIAHWRESVSAIRDAGERAARLTQQLLAFSRKTVLAPKVIDLNELVSESAKLLRRLIGEDIVLAAVTASTPVRVMADPGQMEQVILNLAVNARDAMPTGGRLTIETATDSGPDGTRYARLSVTDTGCGMTDDVKGNIFEPFFTTKGVGKGTGLGLAVVHGVVTQGGGRIEVESKVGRGTTFRLLLPLVAPEATGAAAEATPVVRRGSETVLLVEDEDAVRTIARLSLEMQGYTVLEADGGVEAVRLAEGHRGAIHLLVSDVVMPEMGGRQLVEVVRRYRPNVRVLFMSGYTNDAVLLHGVEEATDAFLQKPFTPLSLARKVREVLDAPTG